MKFLKQFCIIILFSFLGELCRFLIPYPIPASIYGMALMFLALSTKLLKLDQVHDAGSFLTSCLPVLFVSPAVSLMDCWSQLKGQLPAILLIIFIATFLTFVTAGVVTQWLIRRREGGSGHD